MNIELINYQYRRENGFTSPQSKSGNGGEKPGTILQLAISSLTDSIYLFTELIFTEYLIHGQELLEAEWDEALKALNNGMNRDVIYRD